MKSKCHLQAYYVKCRLLGQEHAKSYDAKWPDFYKVVYKGFK